MDTELVVDAPLAHLRWRASVADAPTVVMLHGIGGGREAFGDAMSSTGRQVAEAGFHVLAVDLPGYGLTPSSGTLTMASMARDVQALMQHVGLESAIVLGHSLGGMLAQELHAQAPSRVRGLVLAATSPAFGKADGAWQQDFLRSRLEPLDRGLGMAALASSLVRGMVATMVPHAYLANATMLMASVPEATYRQALHALMGFDRRPNLPAIDVPALCIVGDEDRNAPPPVVKGMADRIRGSAYVCLPGVGHLTNMEAPGAFNRAVIDFLIQRCRHVQHHPHDQHRKQAQGDGSIHAPTSLRGAIS